MSEQLKESLSAVLDGEADAFELRRVIDEASANPELRELWHRQHLLRDVLRGQSYADGAGLREAMWAQMGQLDDTQSPEAEPVLKVASDSQPKTSNWLGRLTGTAVAAAVAGLVVINADLFRSDADNVDVATNVQTLEQATLVQPVMYSNATPADRLRLDGHRMQHYQASALNRAGAVSFVRMMTFKQTQRPGKQETPASEQ